jgi:uncharacterized protein
MIKSGSADLPLHYGQVPPWLAQRMTSLGRAITETIVLDYGASGFLERLSDPFWFQALGCVMGMDWHSSGITTSVMGALKRAINPISRELGVFVCGGRGKYSRETPEELRRLGSNTGLDGNELIRSSRLAAKVDNTAVQDGFQIYLHNFVVSRQGQWAVVQQGMNTDLRTARRYHWHSVPLKSFVDEPHTAVYGQNRGRILNLTDGAAGATREGILSVTRDQAGIGQAELRHLVMPAHHDVRTEDINIKRLGAVLALAYEQQPMDFESLLLMEGVGPRTLQALTLVSEVIHGTPSRFSDPARFSFAHGGKDGHPFPVPLAVYDETIRQLESAVTKARLGGDDRARAIRSLSGLSVTLERDWVPEDRVQEWIEHERATAHRWGGMTVMGPAKATNSGARTAKTPASAQMSLF